jgi:hypothetical protein
VPGTTALLLILDTSRVEGGAVPDRVLTLATELRHELRRVDVSALSGKECAALVRELAPTEKACAATRAVAASRAASSGAHHAAGFRDPADWLAGATGTSSGEAKAALETAEALESCPATRDALMAGELTLAQASEITRTEAEKPGSETDLLDLARRSPIGRLRDEARKRRLAAVDPAELHAKQHGARAVRHWRDELGMVCGRFTLPPEVGTPFVNRLDAETDRVRRRARRDGSDERRETHAADAFANLLAGSGKGRARRADLVLVADVSAWLRGHTHPGEVCHILGGTPVPVALARQLAKDAFLKAVLHDGTRIDTVVHYGRHIPAEVRTALELGDPPDFDGAACIERDCGRRHGLEWDHVDPVANHGPTAYANLQARCWPHHQDKTERDRAAGLLHRGGRTGPDPP